MADTQETPEAPGAGLGMMRLLASGQPLAGQDALEKMASSPVLDPSNKWLHFAAGMSAPNPSRAYSTALSSGLEAYAKSQDTEAELRARYAPIVAQALLNRQMMQFQMAERQHTLATEYHNNLVGALSPLTTPERPGISDDDVLQHIGPMVRSGIVPGDFASQFFNSLPHDPVERKAYIRHAMLSTQKPGELVTSLTPKLELTNTGGGVVPSNVNANAGPTGVAGSTIPTTLKPEDQLLVTVETKNGPFVLSKLTGKSAPAGSPEAQALAAEARATLTGGAAQPPGPGAAMPPGPAPSAPGAPPVARTPPPPGTGAPSVVATTDPAVQAASTGLGESYAKYEDGVNKGVEQMQQLMQRVKEQGELIKQFRPGATGEARGKLGAIAKDTLASFGFPQSQAAAIGDRIAGGNLAAMQEFKKLANQGAMDALRASAGPGQRITQAEFAIFAKNNPNIEMDSDAIEKIQNFITNQYRKALAEQTFVGSARRAGTPLADIPGQWARKAEELGYITPTTTEGTAGGSLKQPSSTSVGVSNSGRRIKLVNGVWEYE